MAQIMPGGELARVYSSYDPRTANEWKQLPAVRTLRKLGAFNLQAASARDLKYDVPMYTATLQIQALAPEDNPTGTPRFPVVRASRGELDMYDSKTRNPAPAGMQWIGISLLATSVVGIDDAFRELLLLLETYIAAKRTMTPEE